MTLFYIFIKLSCLIEDNWLFTFAPVLSHFWCVIEKSLENSTGLCAHNRVRVKEEPDILAFLCS